MKSKQIIAKIYDRRSNTSILTLVSIFLLAITIVFLVRYQFLLLNYIQWGDESETIVVTKMMANGSKLYTDIFNHHGPLTFLPGFIIELFGDFGVKVHRVPIMILQWLALAAVYFSPIVKNKINKIFNFIFIATVMVVFFADIYGSMYQYQVLGGLFSMIILAQFTLPSVLNIPIKKSMAIICNILIISLSFLAVTYIPVSIMFYIVSIRRNNFKDSLIGSITGLLFNLIYLIMFGSLSGYIAYHFYLNLTILSPGQGLISLITTVLTFATTNFHDFLSVIYLLIVTMLLSNKTKEKLPWRCCFVAVIIMAFCVRNPGFSFQGLPYYYSLLGVSPAFFMWADFKSEIVKEDRIKDKLDYCIKYLPCIFIAILCIGKLTLMFNGDLQRIKNNPIPEKTEFSMLAQKITNKDDKILALTFNNYEYIAADRMPASAHFFYLPWQAYYNEKPILGIYSNLAEDIIKNKPKIILADKWKVWDNDNYAWEKYASDIDKVLAERYYKLEGKPYYIRNDINLLDFNLDESTGTDLSEFFLTDENWVNGVSRNNPCFFVINSEANRKKFNIRSNVIFEDGSERQIVDIKEQGKYLNVFVNGDLLDSNVVGIPSKFKVSNYN